ncbi:MAG: LysR family transcriptional regulator [Pseudomonadota bacterium]
MDWRDIPSLAALRAFEAAARLQSYSAAARTLNVTHAAVAQHVRALEDRFGQALMARAGRGVIPTEAGARLASDLARGFAEIAGGVRAIDALRGDGPLSITTTRTFAENWLMPRLPEFWSSHPETPLTISADDTAVDLRQTGHHIGIRYGATGSWPGLDARLLQSGYSVLVAHPKIAARVDGTQDWAQEMAKLPWLIENNFLEFHEWIEAQGISLQDVQVSYFDANPLVLAGTRAGGGVSMQPFPVVQDDLAAGRLVTLMAPGADGPPYRLYIVTPTGPVPDRVRVFEKWLRAQMA